MKKKTKKVKTLRVLSSHDGHNFFPITMDIPTSKPVYIDMGVFHGHLAIEIYEKIVKIK